jgi:hypothetical protein
MVAIAPLLRLLFLCFTLGANLQAASRLDRFLCIKHLRILCWIAFV